MHENSFTPTLELHEIHQTKSFLKSQSPFQQIIIWGAPRFLGCFFGIFASGSVAPEVQVTTVMDVAYSHAYYACHWITPTFSTGSRQSYFSLCMTLF